MEIKANEIRWENRTNPSYKFNFLAFIYNFLHLVSIYTIPSKFKFWLFIKLRDKQK